MIDHDTLLSLVTKLLFHGEAILPMYGDITLVCRVLQNNGLIQVTFTVKDKKYTYGCRLYHYHNIDKTSWRTTVTKFDVPSDIRLIDSIIDAIQTILESE